MPADVQNQNDIAASFAHGPGEQVSVKFSNESLQSAKARTGGAWKATDLIPVTTMGDANSLQFTPLDYGQAHRQQLAAAERGPLDPAAAQGAISGPLAQDQVALNDATKVPAASSTTDHSLASTAQSLDGQQLWRQSKYTGMTQHGRFGCAASMSLVLEKAGIKYADSSTVGGLVGQLAHHGWKKHPAAEAQPNDVMVGYNRGTDWKSGGGNAHIGVVGADGRVYNNSSRQGESWTAEAPDIAFARYDSRYVLRR
jgi:hypothetical protein